MKKRILSVLLAALMVVGSVGTFAIGTAAYEDFTIAAETTKNANDTYDVDIMMYNNPRISSLDLSVVFDNSKVQLVDYEGYDPDNYMFSPTGCLEVTSKLGEGTNALEDFGEDMPITLIYARDGVTDVNGKLLGLTFKLVNGAKNAEIKIVVNNPCVQQPILSVPPVEITPDTVDGFVGVRTLDDVTLDDKTVTYDGNVQYLELNGVDSTMDVKWTNNGKVDSGVYEVTAVVSKPGYETKEFTATLTINKANATLVGVELWSAVEGSEDVAIKSYENAVASALGRAFPLNFNNPKVVKEGDVYKMEGVTVANFNLILDTTVAVNLVPAADLAARIVAEADVANDAGSADVVSPVVSKLPNLDVELPYGYELKFTPVDGVIDADGTITRPEDDHIVVPVEYKLFDAAGNDTGASVTVYVQILKKSSDESTLAMLLLYYNNKLEAAKQQVSSVTSDVNGGVVEAGTKVTLSTSTAGAKIHYTTDGTTATVLSPVYTAPIEVNGTVVINAIATKSGMKTSNQASFSYTVSETNIALKDDAANIKYLEGRGDKFEPTANATRYEVIKAISNLFDINTTNAPLALTDVDDEYKALVDLCTAAGIIKGYEDKTFRGNDTITRAEVATMICNVMKLDVAGAEDAGFKDVSGWATNYVNACANAGYVQGKGDGEFAPSENITRAELATLFNNITGAEAGTSCSYADVDADAWYFGYVAAAAK